MDSSRSKQFEMKSQNIEPFIFTFAGCITKTCRFFSESYLQHRLFQLQSAQKRQVLRWCLDQPIPVSKICEPSNWIMKPQIRVKALLKNWNHHLEMVFFFEQYFLIFFRQWDWKSKDGPMDLTAKRLGVFFFQKKSCHTPPPENW